tara:strand:- start:176 stop:1576 length:1401 start_codon:yes stop_codon:yes gene_type:complete
MAQSRFNQLRAGFANLIDPNRTIRNKFNESFYWASGGGYTTYDSSNTDYIDDGYNINPIVYSAINQMSQKTADIPMYVKQIENTKAKSKLDRLLYSTKHDLSVQQTVMRTILESKAFSSDEQELPLDRPNTYQTWIEFKALYKTFIKTTGNVYIYMLSPDDGPNEGVPVQMYLLPSQYTQIILKENANMLSVESPVESYIMTIGNQFTEFDAKDVIHIKYSNPNFGLNGEHLYGMSPLRAAIRNIQSSNKALDLNIKTLKSGGAFGLIHAKQTPLTQGQADGIKDKLNEMNTSTEDLARIGGVSAEIGFQRIGLTSDELKPFDYLNFDKGTICDVLQWSEELLSNENGGKFDNINQFKKKVIVDNIVPDLKLLTNALNLYWLPKYKGYENSCIEFDVMDLPEMQQDIKILVEWLKESLDRGVINRNEFRMAIKYTATDDNDMDVFTVQSDVISLSESLDNDFNING